MIPQPFLPRYGSRSLAEILPSVAASLGVPGRTNVLELPPARTACLLLIDGLGWQLLQRHPDDAPFLSTLATGSTPLTAGFPSTTATSIASIGTGLPSGGHGLVGTLFEVADGLLMNALGWNTHGPDRPADLRKIAVPEQVQPAPTVFEQLADAGVAVRTVVPGMFIGSGLTRAALRGGDPRGTAALGDLTMHTIDALTSADRTFCYAYHADLDTLGHLYGPGSMPWRIQLRHIDRLAADIADALPADGVLIVTADHGMVDAPAERRIDFDTRPELQAGVRQLGGEARARHVYTEPGATDDVRAAWTETLGDRAWIATRAEAIDAGWFGHPVVDAALPRVGDLVVVMRGVHTVVRTVGEPRFTYLLGHHGSLTEAEQLVPLLVHTGRRQADLRRSA